MITPTFPHCSFKAKDATDMSMMLHYNLIWNIMHYPCGLIPITKVREDEQTFDDHHEDSWTDLLKETAKDSAGMPIGIQVVAHSYEDEKVLAVM